MCRPCACRLNLCRYIKALILLILRTLFSWCPSSPLPLSFFPPPLPQGSLSPEGRDWMEISYLGPSLQRCVILCIMSGCGCLYLFPLAAEGKFSDDGSARLSSHIYMSIAEYHQESFYCYVCFKKNSSIWFYRRSLSYLVSGSWPPKQCQVSVPSHGVGLKSCQILVSYSHKVILCTTFT